MVTHDEWTAAQDRTTVTVDGHDLKLAYWEGGSERDGPPVVFLHGIPTWSYLWRDIAPAVAEHRHVYAIDLLGYGNSQMTDDFDRSIRAQEAMLTDFLDGPASLIAHDIGGGVALRYASHNPVEFISDLGLPSTADADPEDLEAKFDFAFAEGLHGDPDDHQEWVNGIAEPWRSPEGRTSLARCAVATNTNHTTEIDYGAITADTLLLWGADDVLQPIGYAERLAVDIAGDTEIVELEDAFHCVVEDRAVSYREHLQSFLG
ncbi:MAG: alpha/beta fold hydrolase [Salinirussus sp.]